MTHDTLTRSATCVCGEAYTQHGVSVEGMPTIWHPHRCTECSATAESKRLAEEARERHRKETAKLEIRLSSLAVPPLYHDVCLQAFELHGTPDDQAGQAHVLEFATTYLETWPQVPMLCVFAGASGTGKGHVAWSLVQALVRGRGGVNAKVTKLADVIRDLRASWGGDAETEGQVLKVYRSPDLLVIDEVSRHAFYGQQIHQHLYDVLDHRLEWQRPTILTTNETPEGLSDILRPALVDRLQGNGGILNFGAASWRAR